MLKDLLKSLHFSKSETRVILFVAVVITSGYVIKNFRQFVDDAGKPYDYSGVDSEFVKRSLNKVRIKEFSALEDSASYDHQTFAAEIETAGKIIDSAEIEKPAYGGSTININTAGKAELENLPGIGEATAERIIIYREEKGDFKKPEDLMKVKGIGKKKFDKLRNLITVK
jgi:competence protein ComEA